MDTIALIRRQFAHALRLVTLLGVLCTLSPAAVVTQGTPEATPAASPVAIGDGCNGLGTYFQQLAGLTLDNEGLVIMREAGFDALTLTNEQAATVVASIDDLIPQLEGIAPPEPAVPYHRAYLEMMTWYRDLAANRDESSHQRLINNDRRLFSIMGLAIQSGQSACGYDVWNDARNAAFPLEE